MSINVMGPAGSSGVTLDMNTSTMSVQMLTALVFAEALQVRENSQQQQVEYMAAQNKKAKEFNESLAEVTRMMAAYTDEKQDSKRPTKDDRDWSAYAKVIENRDSGDSYEAALNKSSLTTEQKEYFRDRAKLADLAQSLDFLPGGGSYADYNSLAKGDIKRGYLETVRSKLKTAAEEINTNSQLFMIKLQQLIGQVDAIKTALSQFVKTASDSQKEITQKF